jgi:hypothetical protein
MMELGKFVLGLVAMLLLSEVTPLLEEWLIRLFPNIPLYLPPFFSGCLYAAAGGYSAWQFLKKVNSIWSMITNPRRAVEKFKEAWMKYKEEKKARKTIQERGQRELNEMPGN